MQKELEQVRYNLQKELEQVRYNLQKELEQQRLEKDAKFAALEDEFEKYRQ